MNSVIWCTTIVQHARDDLTGEHYTARRGDEHRGITIAAVSKPLNANDDRPVLGVQVTEDAGTRIAQVLTNSNAARADLRVGDLITRVDDVVLGQGASAPGGPDCDAPVQRCGVATMVIARNGQQGIIRVQLAAAAAADPAAGRGGRGRGGIAGGRAIPHSRPRRASSGGARF